MPIEFFALLAVAALIWFWMDSLSAREVAVAAGRRACEQEGLQFLDDTVALARLRLARNAEGQLRFLRRYAFEFSDTGNNRRPGQVTVLGRQLQAVFTLPRVVTVEQSLPGTPLL